MTNVTITLPAEYAARVVADLKALRAAYPDLFTPAMHVVKVRLDVALEDAPPAPAPVGGGALTEDVTDPCETFYAPAPELARFPRHGARKARVTPVPELPEVDCRKPSEADMEFLKEAGPVDAPATTVIVTRPEDLDPEARYALWVCGLEGAHGRGVKCSGHSMRATGTGAEMAAVMGLYRHAYAEHIG